RHTRRRQSGRQLRLARRRLAARKLYGGDETMLQQQLRQAGEPALVVAHPQLLRGRDQLALVPRRIDVPAAKRAHGAHQRVSPRLPPMVEHGLIALRQEGTHAVHSAHVVYTIHGGSPGCGGRTIATPIIASRVTSEASCSSVIASVPCGR